MTQFLNHSDDESIFAQPGRKAESGFGWQNGFHAHFASVFGLPSGWRFCTSMLFYQNAIISCTYFLSGSEWQESNAF